MMSKRAAGGWAGITLELRWDQYHHIPLSSHQAPKYQLLQMRLCLLQRAYTSYVRGPKFQL